MKGRKAIAWFRRLGENNALLKLFALALALALFWATRPGVRAPTAGPAVASPALHGAESGR